MPLRKLPHPERERSEQSKDAQRQSSEPIAFAKLRRKPGPTHPLVSRLKNGSRLLPGLRCNSYRSLGRTLLLLSLLGCPVIGGCAAPAYQPPSANQPPPHREPGGSGNGAGSM